MARLRFKLDENLPRDAVTLLEQAGHDVDTVPNQNLAGHPDAEVLQACQQERRTLVTLDLGFADLGLYSPTELQGIVVLRTPTQSIARISALVAEMLRVADREQLPGHLWIVEPDRGTPAWRAQGAGRDARTRRRARGRCRARAPG